MLVLGALVAIQAPQFLSASNLTQVTVLAAIIGVAAVGESMVIITRNIDLSVEAVIGLVAFVVADLLARHVLDTPAAIAFGIGLGLVLGMVNGILVAFLGVPSIVATLGTLSIYRGIDFLIAGGKQVTARRPAAGLHRMARATFIGIPVFVWLALIIIASRPSSCARPVQAVGLRGREQPGGRRDPRHPHPPGGLLVFSVCGLLAGVTGVLWGILFGTINATAATGVTLQVIAAGRRRRRQHLRRVRHASSGRPSARCSLASSRTPSSCCACRSSGCRRMLRRGDPRRRRARRVLAAPVPALGGGGRTDD